MIIHPCSVELRKSHVSYFGQLNVGRSFKSPYIIHHLSFSFSMRRATSQIVTWQPVWVSNKLVVSHWNCSVVCYCIIIYSILTTIRHTLGPMTWWKELLPFSLPAIFILIYSQFDLSGKKKNLYLDLWVAVIKYIYQLHWRNGF